MLHERGESREDIIKLFRFIDWLLTLPKELELEARQRLAEIDKENVMPYVTSIERLAREEGLKEGREQGREQGQKEGEEQGLRQGILEAIELGLELRFGKERFEVLARVKEITAHDRLRKLKEAIPEVQSLEEFGGLLSKETS